MIFLRRQAGAAGLSSNFNIINMTKRYSLPLYFFLLVFLPANRLFAQSPATTIPIGITDSLYSAVLKEGRTLKVYLPHSYTDSNARSGRYPVIYLLDAAANFKPLAGMMEFLSAGIDDGSLEIPEMIIVAIDNTDRTRDLTPTHTLRMPGSDKEESYLQSSGGGDHFIRFLEKELIPHIDTNYRTANYRILIGHSFGGLTAINIFLHHTALFNAYIAIDPSLWWDQQYLLRRGIAALATRKFNGTELYLAGAHTPAYGADSLTMNIHHGSIRQFARALNKYRNNGLHAKWQDFPGEEHSSVPMLAEYYGLKFLFDGYLLTFSKVYNDPAAIIPHYDSLSTKFGVRFRPPESALNGIASYALAGHETDKAIRIFGANLEYYPDSYAANLGLGDALLQKGDKQKARASYEKALRLHDDAALRAKLLK
ncbi:MAG TPA: alpha/beta hydrolase-fold protein [Puia sp.]